MNQYLDAGYRRLMACLIDSPDSERGATATEYALIVAFIAIAIVLAVTVFGTNLAAYFQRSADYLATVL